MEAVIRASARDRVERELAGLDAPTFTGRYILDRLPALFATSEQYADWRAAVGKGLGVDPLNLVVVGSTAVGFSLSPGDKFMRAVHEGSDVDLAVISPRHFEEAWKWLRSLGPLQKLQRKSKEADLLSWHRRSLIFDGTIAAERLLSELDFGADWATTLGRAAQMDPTRDRDIKARIYRDFESLRQYHEKNVENLRATLLAQVVGADPRPLPTSKAGA